MAISLAGPSRLSAIRQPRLPLLLLPWQERAGGRDFAIGNRNDEVRRELSYREARKDHEHSSTERASPRGRGMSASGLCHFQACGPNDASAGGEHTYVYPSSPFAYWKFDDGSGTVASNSNASATAMRWRCSAV